MLNIKKLVELRLALKSIKLFDVDVSNHRNIGSPMLNYTSAYPNLVNELADIVEDLKKTMLDDLMGKLKDDTTKFLSSGILSDLDIVMRYEEYVSVINSIRFDDGRFISECTSDTNFLKVVANRLKGAIAPILSKASGSILSEIKRLIVVW
jgi:hypothetical protein